MGRSSFQFWCIEDCQRLDLDIYTLTVHSDEAETARGVRVNVEGICQVKVDAFVYEDATDPNSTRILNKPALSLACQHFLGRSRDDIKNSILRTLEGHQRQILGTLTVEELYKDRAAFADRVREHVFSDIQSMGFVLLSYTVTQIADDMGYMAALGVTQSALVHREAAEGKAKNEALATKATSMYQADADSAAATSKADAHVQVSQQQQLEALADRDLKLKKAAYDAEVNRAQAEAAASKDIEMARQHQQVIAEETQQRVIAAKIMLDYQDAEALRTQKELEGHSKAKLLEKENQAKGVRVEAEADAERVRQLGQAEADVIIAKGEAEAKVLQLRADAYKSYGQAAIVNEIVERLPEIASAMAGPLSQTEKMVFVSTDGSAGSKLTADVSAMMAQLPAAIQGVTGYDFSRGLAGIVSGTSGSGTSGIST